MRQKPRHRRVRHENRRKKRVELRHGVGHRIGSVEVKRGEEPTVRGGRDYGRGGPGRARAHNGERDATKEAGISQSELEAKLVGNL